MNKPKDNRTRSIIALYFITHPNNKNSSLGDIHTLKSLSNPLKIPLVGQIDPYKLLIASLQTMGLAQL